MVGLENDGRNAPPSYATTTLMHHPEYYAEKGNLIVQVEDTLFKISDIKFWTHSSFFDLVSQENGTTLTETAQQPRNEGGIWKLKDVKAKDFTRLLWILYPEDHGACQVTTVDDWESVLKLADRWRFNDIFSLAVRSLALLSIDPVRKIAIMHRHQIRQEWVIDALVKLALEPEFPSDSNAKIIGLEMVTRLARTREKARYIEPFWNRGKAGPVKEVVREVFGLGPTEPVAWKA